MRKPKGASARAAEDWSNVRIETGMAKGRHVVEAAAAARAPIRHVTKLRMAINISCMMSRLDARARMAPERMGRREWRSENGAVRVLASARPRA
jgi:hypothetical protein